MGRAEVFVVWGGNYSETKQLLGNKKGRKLTKRKKMIEKKKIEKK